jgi:hypothetical protein
MRKEMHITDVITRIKDYQTKWGNMWKGCKVSESQKSFPNVIQQGREIQEDCRRD